MKFTRSLALAAAAAFAMTMTACDDDSTGSENSIPVTTIELSGGSQKSTYGSFFSIRKDTVYNSTTAQNHWADIDMVYFADTTRSGSPLTFFAPTAARTTFAHLSVIPTAQANATKFYPVPSDVDFDEVKTNDQLTAVIAKIDVTKEDTRWNVETNLVFVVKTVDGKFGLVENVYDTTFTSGGMRAGDITIKVMR